MDKEAMGRMDASKDCVSAGAYGALSFSERVEELDEGVLVEEVEKCAFVSSARSRCTSSSERSSCASECSRRASRSKTLFYIS